MSGQMPILSKNNLIKITHHIIDLNNYFVTILNCQCATRTEIILQVNNDQSIYKTTPSFLFLDDEISSIDLAHSFLD